MSDKYLKAARQNFKCQTITKEMNNMNWFWIFLDLLIRGILTVALLGGIYTFWYMIGQIESEEY